MSLSSTPRAKAAARGLGAIYGFYGAAATLTPLQGPAVTIRAIMRVHDREEGLDGQAIETQIKGYAAQVRRSDLGGVAIDALHGALLELTGDTFEGYDAFSIDAVPRSYGREGLQVLFSLSAAPALDDADLA